jgi:GAF domain-containing protein
LSNDVKAEKKIGDFLDVSSLEDLKEGSTGSSFGSFEQISDLEKSRLFADDEIGATSAKLLAVEEFFALATRDCNFNDFIRGVLDVFIRAVKSESGSILELDHANQSLFFRTVIGVNADSLINFNIPVGQGVSGHVAESKLPLTVDNVPENTIHLKSISKMVGFEPRNLVCIPVLIRGKVYGVVELLNRIGEKNYTSSDLATLNYLSKMASKIIEIRMMISWANQRRTAYESK